MIEVIYVIFGNIQHGIIMNTSVKYILNKFIIQVAPPSDKV